MPLKAYTVRSVAVFSVVTCGPTTCDLIQYLPGMRLLFNIFSVIPKGMSPEEAFRQSSESITGPITKSISKGGILQLYEGLDKSAQEEFKASFSSSISSRVICLFIL